MAIEMLFSNSKWSRSFKYLIYFVLLFITKKAGINDLIYPFGFGLFFALVWCNQNPIFTSLVYLCASILTSFSLYTLIESFLFIIIFLLCYGVHYKLKKPIKYIHLLVYASLCNFPKIFINVYFFNANIYLVFVEFIVGLLYTYAFMKVLEKVCIRGLGLRMTTLETITAMFVIGSIFCGLTSLNLYNFEFVKLIGGLLLLIFSYISNMGITLLIGASMGVGCLLYTNNPTYLIIFILYALTTSAFRTKNKYITSVALIATEVFSIFYLKFYPEINIVIVLPIIFAVLIYLIIPNKILDKYGSDFQTSTCGLTQQSVINRNREMLHHRLMELSDVFAEMNKVYRSMISGGLAGSDAKKLLLNELKIKNCNDCPNQGKCYRMLNDETRKSLNTLVDIGMKRGKVNLLDVPTVFAGKCERLNSIVLSINDLIAQYKNYAGLINNIDTSKVLLAEQLMGVSNIMKELSLDVDKEVNFERGKEKKIIDELTYNNIICSEALVFQDKDEVMSVSLSIRKDDAMKSTISKVVSKICSHKMEICDESSSNRAGWQLLTLKSAPKYDVVFGVATKTKTGSIKSGDCYSIIKINESKYLFALCDGMGSGEKAEQTSSTAIGLIENFYKAGFDNDIIISSVNKLLSLGKEDVFSALDLCVVDIRNGIGDFVKMGAPESFIKHKETTDVISIGALPLGIIQNIETKTKQVYLTSGDKIVLVTDGVTDSFKSIDDFVDFVNNIKSNNPQAMADEIIDKALSLNKNIAKDDMSVIISKIFER